MLPPPFLAEQQLPDFLRRSPIRYSCLGSVCLFVWSIGANKPVIVIALPNPLRHAPPLNCENCASSSPGWCHPLNLGSNTIAQECYSTTPMTYGSLLSSSFRRRNASFRATATMAFFLLPQFLNTRRNFSSNTGSYRIATHEHSTSHDLTRRFPCLVICPRRSASPLE